MEVCNCILIPINILRKEKKIQKTKSVDFKPHSSLTTPQDICDITQKIEYQSLVGSPMYLITATYPDLTYTISILCKFNSSHAIEHLLQAK
ncbi:hypothetical protein L873DRAFT_1884584 [Choiromyces venosus 120613-1]|uniref:Uncharacterized protein n=1 Tax=Choiromyces venosus 120613-1 TaxID=1336337 RepID=A0A3N4JUG2_9PEZI|nr:hypothetical protein L873DRAFT_1884584 [Choiromyces venosus 120613-1]